MTQKAKKALMIGSMCFFSYLAVYLARNILSAVTPAMQSQGFAKESIGLASSIYFYTYAVGQLINGLIGNKVKAKYMMCFGLAFAGISHLLFAYLTHTNGSFGDIPLSAYVAYGAAGFSLSMIYGPMTKIVSENLEMPYTTRCSLGYTFASYFGSPVAGLLATFLAWQSVFYTASTVLIVMAVTVFITFLLFERKGIIVYGRFQREKKQGKRGSLRLLLDRQIVKFSFISVLTGIVRTSVLFWLPDYFAERLSMANEEATLTFTVASLFISCGAFLVIFLYEKLFHYDMNKTVLVMFACAAAGFTLTYFSPLPALNVVTVVLSIMASNGAATMLWSHYCPSLRDTGMVSGATGFLDFLSYMAAATANIVFPFLIEKQHWPWDRIVLIWLALMVVGVGTALPWRKLRKGAAKE